MENSKPRIAVCLAAYNGMRWLPQQIETIIGQVGVDVTIFISVDRSTDGTDGFVKSLADGNSKIINLPYGLRYGGAAKNFFRLLEEVEFSEFEYVAFADQDDIWRIEKLRRAVDVLELAKADGYSSNVTAFWESGQKVQINKAQPQREWDFLFESAGPGCTYVMRPALVARVKECLCRSRVEMENVGLHDWFVYAFARANGFKWVIDDFYGLWYRQHSSNELGANQGLRAYLSRAKKVLNGWGLRQSYLIARMIGLADHPFVLRWCRMRGREMVWLAFQGRKCRRKTRDQLLFGISCLGLAMLGISRR